MKRSKKQLNESDAGAAPILFSWMAATIPLIILLQILLAGLGLFHHHTWFHWYSGFGIALALPICLVSLMSLIQKPIRTLRWWTSALFLQYLLYIALAIMNNQPNPSWFIAAHSLNTIFLLATSLIIVHKIHQNHNLL